ncbi:tyrosine-type recombinase/integrase [Halomonas sp. 1390]|uniref:tyrosine-type recombinase/integrase n=1 Tax=Halomonas sp. B23F22_3 TaxID=3459516 RepID=UPI00373E24B8
MAGTIKRKLTSKALEGLVNTPPTEDVYDTELPGFHVRPSRRGLTFRLYYRTRTGRQRVLTLGRYGTLTAAQARKGATEALAIVAQGGDPRAEIEGARADAERQQQQTIRAYLNGPYAVTQRRKKDGAATLRRIYNAFADWLDRPMYEISRADIERWQGEREAKGEAYTTSKRSLGALKTMLAHAADRKVIPANPLARINLQRPAMTEEAMAEQGSQRRYLEDDEVKALFSGLEAYQERKRAQRRSSRSHGKPYLPDLDGVAYVDHVMPWLLTMYYTGLRPGDLFGLRWEHVNLDFRTIRKVVEKTAHYRPEPTTFPLSTPAVDVLRAWHRLQGKPKTGHVFPSGRNGKRMSDTAMQRPWATVRKLAGLPDDLQLYTLRHNFASQLVMAGIDLLTVSRLMGHTDIQTTIEYYAHLRPDHSRDAVEVFAKRTHFVEEGCQQAG